jgi:hypothetical protein
MKTILIAIGIILALSAVGQRQEGQTCLFTCMNHLGPSKSVFDYIRDFNRFTGTRQDVYSDGAAGTVKELSQFIKSEFDTKDLDKTSIIDAIDSGYSVISMVHSMRESEYSNLAHVIVLEGYSSTDPKNPETTYLVFYDPLTGSDAERIPLEDFLTNWQVYGLGVKRRGKGQTLAGPPFRSRIEYFRIRPSKSYFISESIVSKFE